MIVFSKVKFAYDSHIIFEDLSYTFEAGKNYILSGRNGAGKSTFLRLAASLITPSLGTVTYKTKAPRIGFVSHQSMCYRNLTVLENFKFFSGDDYLSSAKLWQIDSLLQKKVSTLSRGETLRLSLALAMLNNPEILILDEPTASLDSQGIETLNQQLSKFCTASNQCTVIIATHELQKFKIAAQNIEISGRSLNV